MARDCVSFFVDYVDNPESKLSSNSMPPLEMEEIRALNGEVAHRWGQDALVAYISDMHLTHSIVRRFGEEPTSEQVDSFIAESADNLGSQINDYDLALFCGDVSSDFSLTMQFFERLAYVAYKCAVVYILGNHELWPFPGKTVDEIASLYAEAFEELRNCRKVRFYFLQNAVFSYEAWGEAPREHDNAYPAERVITEGELLAMTPGEIAEVGAKARLLVFGGIGFSANETKWNASSGMYLGVVSREEEARQSQRISKLHRLLRDNLSTENMVVATHMPLDSWDDGDGFDGRWVYVSGHTHNSHLEFTDAVKHFADNQVGYDADPKTMKTFRVSKVYDVFKDKQDGVHEITFDQYRDFCVGANMHVRSVDRRGIRRLYLLRKNGISMFVGQRGDGGLMLYDGGSKRTLANKSTRDLLDKMDTYCQSVSSAIAAYEAAQREIAREVMALGGSGRIHGCIIDISRSDHLFLNPMNGYLAAYDAQDVVRKRFFENPASLLALKGYIEAPSDIDNGSLIALPGMVISKRVRHVDDLWHYSMSRKMMNLKRINGLKVIRDWDEDLLDSAHPEEIIGEGIVRSLLEKST